MKNSKKYVKNEYGNLYLRDIKQDLQDDHIAQWKKKGRKDLLKAFENGDDIAIGDYNNSVMEDCVA